MNDKDTILTQLRTIGLSNDEARLYLELLKEPSTHLRVAHATGINRTKVYRLVEDLEKRSLVSRRTDDRGTFLTAADPSTLEVAIVTQEEKVRQQRVTLKTLVPALENLKQEAERGLIVHTYEGVEGFKQMLWHELKTKDEMYILGGSNIDDLVDDKPWAERHRIMTVEAGYRIRELLNPRDNEVFTLNPAFMSRYTYREIAPATLALYDSIAIYNHTVAIYHWRDEKKVGIEIVDQFYTEMIRQFFEHYWQLALN